PPSWMRSASSGSFFVSGTVTPRTASAARLARRHPAAAPVLPEARDVPPGSRRKRRGALTVKAEPQKLTGTYFWLAWEPGGWNIPTAKAVWALSRQCVTFMQQRPGDACARPGGTGATRPSVSGAPIERRADWTLG